MQKDKPEQEILFREMVGAVRPIKQSSKRTILKETIKHKRRSFKSDLYSEEPLFLPLSDSYTEALNAEDTVEHMAEGAALSPQILKKIRRGEYPKEETIDLHGETIDSAREILSTLLQQAYHKQRRGLLIIHGKGKQAILKKHVIHWLKQIPWVTYFCSASPREGGAGALYVLLKRKKIESIIELRNKIDSIDNKISALLCERFDYAKKVAKLKKTTVPDMRRENDILKRMKQYAVQTGVSPQRMEAIYLVLLAEMKKYQEDK
jgi:DNA-nicking Smr family endonuclease/chorismate mutase